MGAFHSIPSMFGLLSARDPRMQVSKLLSPDPPDPQKAHIIHNLLRGVWGFGFPTAVPKAKAASCFYHYETLLSNQRLLDDQNTDLRDSGTQSSDVIQLVTSLRQQANTSITDIRTSLQNNPPAWLLNPQSHEAQDKVLSFAVRLWLFTKPDLGDGDLSLQDAVRNPLSKISSTSSNAWIWLDFSANTLTRRAGFHIMWTSDLSEHLTFASKSVIRVFSHASVLERYESTDESKIYPPGFLREVRKTLNLLWPIEDVPTAKQVYNLEAKEEVDIEAGMGHDEKFDLRTYPVFGERLAKIQERLEFVEHRRGQSFAFKIAIWGIVLSAVFGLISAITGIMQVWASFKSG